MRAPQRDQAAIVSKDIVIIRLLLPTQHVDRVRLVVAIMVTALAAQELLPGMYKRNALRSQQECRRQLIHRTPVGFGYGGVVNGADEQPVPKRVIVVALDVVD